MAIRPGPNGYDGHANPKKGADQKKESRQRFFGEGGKFREWREQKGLEGQDGDVELSPTEKWQSERKKGMSVDLFKYNFDSGARANRFNVNFMCPPLGIYLQGLRCTNATLPGRQIETSDFSTYGPLEKRPFNVGMDGQEVSFTFVCDSTFADRFILEAWQGAIFSGPGSVGNSVNPQFSYIYGNGKDMNGYAGTVEIQQYTRSDKLSLTYELMDAFPIGYAAQQLDSSAGDALMQFECTFAFRTFSTKYSQPANSTALNRGSRWLDAMLDIGNLKNGGNSSNNTLQRFNDRLKSFSGLFG